LERISLNPITTTPRYRNYSIGVTKTLEVKKKELFERNENIL